mgnify:CR=1 FL=1|jgi:hypothetical protein
MKKLRLPRLKLLELNNFSLYDAKDNRILINLEKPVSCIVGANGLGKSTLLNCINYGLTGLINNRKKFQTVSEFCKNNRFAHEYFEGRISENDRDSANVTVTFSIGNSTLKVSRNFYPNNSVVSFICDQGEYTTYEEAVVDLMGLSTFDQFVFLIVKVLTFDEERECLFWEPNILTPTLYLALDINPETAAKADMLANEVQRSNSRIRNFQYEIKKLERRIKVLQAELETEVNEVKTEELTEAEIKEQYDALIESLHEADSKYQKTKKELDLLTVRISELNSQYHQIKREYDDVYNSMFIGGFKDTIKNNPVMVELYKGTCPVCNTQHAEVWKKADQYIQNEICPLCENELHAENKNQDQLLQKLRELDEQLSRITKEIDESILKTTRLRNEQEATIAFIDKKKQELAEFEQAPIFLLLNGSNKQGLNEEIRQRIISLNNAISEVEADKKKETARRDALREEVLELHRLLNEKYEEAQKTFLPKFRTLARKFIGLDVDIEFTRETADAKELFAFVLTLHDSGRKYEHQLSESQRFFIDIALRMAIVDYISDGQNEGTMLIDTPEGSLDIAYEVNAGEMFAEFVSRGHQIVITANLNSSGLVRTLAQQTGKNMFDLINMLNWANLSSVQRARMVLFNNALAEIQELLRKRN